MECGKSQCGCKRKEPKARKEDSIIGVRFATEDRAWIEASCRDRGMKISDMLRGLVAAARDRGVDSILGGRT